MSNLNLNIKEKRIRRNIKENIELYIIMLPVLIHIFIFCYIPMYGIVIAFQDYYPGSPFLSFDGSIRWVGFKHIIEFVKSIYFTRVLGNTVRLSICLIIFGFWVPIAFSILLNELKNGYFKKIVQTGSYLPHFISTVVVAGMVISFISTDGILNKLIVFLGGQKKDFLVNSEYFASIYTITNIWKTFGWSTILYLSNIAAINPNLYEAAKIDGANRFHRIWHVTIPSILPSIDILLIFAIGGLLNSNSQLILLIYNPALYKKADVIGTFLYRSGIVGGQFSYGTAVGLFMTIINFILLYIANAITRKRSDHVLW